MAGRVALINSILNSLPLLYLSFFKAPKVVRVEITKLQRQFLWGSKQGLRKIAWIRWDKITQSKQQGGLGVKDIKAFNIALLAKWRWNLFHQPNYLWVRVLCSKYGGFQNLCAQNAIRKDSVWGKDLLKACGGLELDEWFGRQLEWKMNSGRSVRFWLDNWRGCAPLAVTFPSLFVLSEQQHDMISDMGSLRDGKWWWNLRWNTNKNERDINLEIQLRQMIGEWSSPINTPDMWIWKSETSGLFSVKTTYRVLQSENLIREENSVFKWLWSIKAPQKALIFL